MKVIIAPDKFKGSLTAQEVCLAIRAGLLRFNPDLEAILNPLADGGDGSLEVLKHYLNLEEVKLTVSDPLIRPIQATYKMSGEDAYIEMSKASGLVLLKEEERNCMETSTYGTGEMILDAVQKGAKNIYLFIGGSATNDGGVGIANALGYRFYDRMGRDVRPIGKNIGYIMEIDNSHLKIDLDKVNFKVICDVNNPFYGPNGAAFVYAPQKGAKMKEVVHFLDLGLRNLSKVIEKYKYPSIAKLPGAGAAGGVGGGAVAFLNAELVSGISNFLELTNFEEKAKDADLIITGEGKIDGQTEQGKVISGVSEIANKRGIPIVAICGDSDIENPNLVGLNEIFTVRSRASSLQESMENATPIIEKLAFELIHFYG